MHAAKSRISGILLVDKQKGDTAFSLVRKLRKLTGERKIGHAGTLDPAATGVMVMLIGRDYTRLSDRFLCQDKEYIAKLQLGATTDTYDAEGVVTPGSDDQPTPEQIAEALLQFQGEIDQIPPMFSAKKIDGKKLYELARKGKTVERKPCRVKVELEILDYTYPHLELRVACSKGTYVRSIAHDLGQALGCGAYLVGLRRSRSGSFSIDACVDGARLEEYGFNPLPYLLKYDRLNIT